MHIHLAFHLKINVFILIIFSFHITTQFRKEALVIAPISKVFCRTLLSCVDYLFDYLLNTGSQNDLFAIISSHGRWGARGPGDLGFAPTDEPFMARRP